MIKGEKKAGGMPYHVYVHSNVDGIFYIGSGLIGRAFKHKGREATWFKKADGGVFCEILNSFYSLRKAREYENKMINLFYNNDLTNKRRACR